MSSHFIAVAGIYFAQIAKNGTWNLGLQSLIYLFGGNMKFIPRLYIDDAILGEGVEFPLSKPHCHYLFNVLRLGENDEFFGFDGKNGQWLIKIIAASKKNGMAKCIEQTREQEFLPDLTLYFAPIKGHRNDAIIEKATELGATKIIPVITEHTIVRKTNSEKMRANAIEAAEQCERLNVPQIEETISLDSLLGSYPENAALVFADEAGDGVFIADALKNAPEKLGLLIGPEGGFSPKERERIISHKATIPISLGKRILRADTASFAGLSLIQTFWGDWAK